MAITLDRDVIVAQEKLHGEEADVVIPAGKRLRIETTPDGVEILDALVPSGKQWTATVSVSIDETDQE